MLDELRRRQRAGQTRPLDLHELRRHRGIGFRRGINDDRREKRDAFQHQMRALDGEFPFQPEISLAAILRIRGNDGHKEGAFLDLAADFLVPRIAAAQFVLVELHLDAVTAEGLSDALG